MFIGFLVKLIRFKDMLFFTKRIRYGKSKYFLFLYYFIIVDNSNS